jgi:hypothetical protein
MNRISSSRTWNHGKPRADSGRSKDVHGGAEADLRSRPRHADTGQLLRDRGPTHGDYEHPARLAQMIKATFSEGRNWASLPPIQKESLELKATKLARILQGNRACKDHWLDDAGYSQLVVDSLD